MIFMLLYVLFKEKHKELFNAFYPLFSRAEYKRMVYVFSLFIFIFLEERLSTKEIITIILTCFSFRGEVVQEGIFYLFFCFCYTDPAETETTHWLS